MTELLPLATGYDDIVQRMAEFVRGLGLLKAGATIEPIGRPMTEEWLSKNAVRHGAACPSIAGVDRVELLANGIEKHVLSVGLYVVPDSDRGKRQDAEMLRDVGAIVSAVKNETFGLRHASTPNGLRAVNRNSPSLAKAGSCLWMIDWRQAFGILDVASSAPRTAVDGLGNQVAGGAP